MALFRKITCNLKHPMSRRHPLTLQHSAAHCNTLQHTATNCSTLQHTAAHCSTLQHIATHCSTLQHWAALSNTLQHFATLCNTLQHFAALCNTLPYTATHCSHSQSAARRVARVSCALSSRAPRATRGFSTIFCDIICTDTLSPLNVLYTQFWVLLSACFRGFARDCCESS